MTFQSWKHYAELPKESSKDGMTVHKIPPPSSLNIGEVEDMLVMRVPVKIIDEDGNEITKITEIGTHRFTVCRNSHDMGVFWVYLGKIEFLKKSGNGVDIGDEIDWVNHPPHYTSSAECSHCKKPIECIDVTRHMSFNIGNAMKYLWRHKSKNGLQDLKKAQWYIKDAIEQMEKK